METASISVANTPLLRLTLERADDALVLGHRLSEWCGKAPMMEEEMALSNTALDLIGQATALYQYASVVENAGRNEDAYAYLRTSSSSSVRTATLPRPSPGCSCTRRSSSPIGGA
jgi:ring-1,2-phenylacetyl-CoA epoxidase subunit PaaC